MRLFLPFILQALFSMHPTSGSSTPPNLILAKTYTTPSNQTYTYTFAAPTNASLPTLLLLHGYPSSRHDWTTQIRALTCAGYGVLAPDLLGFGDSSKPTAIEAYNTKTLSTHLIQLLDAEGLPFVVGVGHDWGANLLGKAAAFFPARFEKLVFVAVGYYPPGVLLDVDAINKAAVEAGGAAPLGYWYFFNSWDAAHIIEGHVRILLLLFLPFAL
jgi:soluble epoxide hydrolase/lipid-phosphate phosphatase